MSNILIIKHGSLGDLIQANGAIEDIKREFKTSKVLLLTSLNYVELMSHCSYVDGVITDKRSPRWNLFYLKKLKKILEKYNFSHVFDLQNSSRTNFYRKFILPKPVWSSSETILEKGQKKIDFDNHPVLDRLEAQLIKSKINVKSVKKIDLKWSYINIEKIINEYFSGPYILLFPFCSKKHVKKKWPYYNELIAKLKKTYSGKYNLALAPGPNEIEDCKNFDSNIILKNNKALNLRELISLIKGSSYVISNDTGPAHIASHLKKKGLVLFGQHTSVQKVSIETSTFKSLSVKDLKDLEPNIVLETVTKELN